MKILHIHTLPVISGSGINTLLTMQGSIHRGHEVSLACESTGRLTGEAAKSGVTIHLVPSLGREIDPARDLTSAGDLAELIRRKRFDLVHTHNSKAGFVGRLAAKVAGVPLTIHTVHGFAFHDAESPLRRSIFRIFERQAAHWCDGLIFISRPLELWADNEEIGRGIPRRVIYSGIDVAAFREADGGAVRRELGISPDALVAGIISKLWEGKGHLVLLHAWKSIQKRWDSDPPPVLLVVGEGPLDPSLRLAAVALGVADGVIFTGFRSDVPAVTAAIDVSVLPSAFEGMGRVVLEAMAAGKPVVASRVGGIPDLVTDGINGFLVPPNDAESLAEALERLLKDEQLRRAMGDAAAASVEHQHSAAGMIDEIHAFYEFAAASKKV